VDDSLALPNALSAFTAGTVIFACKVAADPAAASATSGGAVGDWGTSAQGNHYPYSDGVVYSDCLSTTRKSFNPTPSLAAWHVGEFRSAAGAWAYAVNGVDVYTTATNTVGGSLAPVIGQSINGSASLSGYMGRMIVIPRILSGADLANARTWVGAGSGMVL
jgi:hypothetical protein